MDGQMTDILFPQVLATRVTVQRPAVRPLALSAPSLLPLSPSSEFPFLLSQESASTTSGALRTETKTDEGEKSTAENSISRPLNLKRPWKEGSFQCCQAVEASNPCWIQWSPPIVEDLLATKVLTVDRIQIIITSMQRSWESLMTVALHRGMPPYLKSPFQATIRKCFCVTSL